jgi:diguanylate cyclase (GGDEF)-like protein
LTQDQTDPPAPPRGNRLLQGIRDAHLVGLIPLMVLIAYWVGNDAVLFVVSFIFPLLYALQALIPAAPANVGPVLGAMSQTTARLAGSGPGPGDIDPLTGLAKRQALLSQLSDFLMAVRSSGRICAVLVLDLDQFRHVNDRFGIEAGDAILKITAARITGALREQDVAARIDGDRFAVVLAPLGRAEFENVMAVAARLRDVIADPIPFDHSVVKLSSSVGVCLAGRAPENGAAPMLQAAEEALIEARTAGIGSICSFSPRMRRESRKTRALSADLDGAFARGEFEAWFQPQIATESGAITAMEALARWRHPDEGVLPPQRFLKALEAAAAAPMLGEVILAQALTALKEWDHAGYEIPSVSINFSTAELGDPQFCDRIKWETDRQEIEPARVAIEIRETTLNNGGSDSVARNLQQLKDHGFRLDLDNFGTGCASIATIRRFRIDRIKIDRCFISALDQDPDQKSTVTGILRLASTLGLDVVAQGVETREEKRILAELGCACVQGFAIGRPMSAPKAVDWIESYLRSLDNRPPMTGTS